MRLRNKKTGKIVDLSEGLIIDKYNGEFIQIKPVAISDKERYLYGSLAALNEEWEDYKPAEPLIKDEKIRKAVRAWAEAFNVDVAYLAPIGDGSKFVELFNEDSDGFERIAIPAENIKQEQCYTIEELCGEGV